MKQVYIPQKIMTHRWNHRIKLHDLRQVVQKYEAIYIQLEKKRVFLLFLFQKNLRLFHRLIEHTVYHTNAYKPPEVY